FTGFLNQSEIVRAFVASDVLVLPSDGGETWGVIVNEAMSCGKPCIVSDRVGCGPDLVVSGDTWFLFALGGIAELDDRVVESGSDRPGLEQMGERAVSGMTEYSVPTAVVRLRDAVYGVAA